MNRRALLFAGVAAAVMMPRAALADPVGDIVAQLRAMGFVDIAVSTTMLGRARVLATQSGRFRELIVNPRTGEILRDVWISDRDDGHDRGDGRDDQGDDGRVEDDEHDDDDDHDDHRDNSGHGNADD